MGCFGCFEQLEFATNWGGYAERNLIPTFWLTAALMHFQSTLSSVSNELYRYLLNSLIKFLY